MFSGSTAGIGTAPFTLVGSDGNNGYFGAAVASAWGRRGAGSRWTVLFARRPGVPSAS